MHENLEITAALFSPKPSAWLGDRMGKLPAHMLVEAACKKALAEKRHLKDVLLREPGWHGQLTPADLESLFEVRNYLGSSEEFTARVLSEAVSFSARR
jgi:3-carboxy-cis,cis-muconate cycloisomerase